MESPAACHAKRPAPSAAVVDYRLKNGLCHECGAKIYEIHQEEGGGKRQRISPLTIPGVVQGGRCLFCYPSQESQQQVNLTPLHRVASKPAKSQAARYVALQQKQQQQQQQQQDGVFVPVAKLPHGSLSILTPSQDSCASALTLSQESIEMAGEHDDKKRPQESTEMAGEHDDKKRPAAPSPATSSSDWRSRNDSSSPRKKSPTEDTRQGRNNTQDEEKKQPPIPSSLTICDADGLEYIGKIQQGTAQKGRGVFTRLHPTTGKVISYTGEFENGKMHGHGVSDDAESGVVYTGDFCQGAAHGNGVCKWSQGWEYNGEWRNDKRHGRGTCRQLTARGEVYTGEWQSDMWDGKGTLKFAGSGSYKGTFKRDKLHGKGVYEFADGSVYDGYFKDDLREGHGSMRYQDDVRYVGEWRNNWRSGKGSLFYLDGSVFKGRWRADEKEGVGYLHLPDGIAKRERWVNGVLQSNS